MGITYNETGIIYNDPKFCYNGIACALEAKQCPPFFVMIRDTVPAEVRVIRDTVPAVPVVLQC